MAGPVFRPIPVPTDLPVLYQLSIRAPGAATSEFATYTFPLSPSMVRYAPSSLSAFRDTQGPPSTQGVTRVLDRYGQSPPMVSIEGTTGWDRHSLDGYLLTGLQSSQLLVAFLAQYQKLNAVQVQSGNAQLYSLEWFDYFRNQFWIVEPIGPQTTWQDANRPLLVNYRLLFAAAAPVGTVDVLLHGVDALANVLATPAQQAALTAAQTLGAIAVAYGPTGIAAALP